MARERLKLEHFGWNPGSSKPDKVVEVEYRERPREEWDECHTYDVLVDGETVGYVEQVRANTARPACRGSRLVVRQKGSLQWAWGRPRNADEEGMGYVYNPPGLYARSRREAVAELFGYHHATRIPR